MLVKLHIGGGTITHADLEDAFKHVDIHFHEEGKPCVDGCRTDFNMMEDIKPNTLLVGEEDKKPLNCLCPCHATMVMCADCEYNHGNS